MLIEIAIRIEGIADVVNKLEGLADFACNGPDLKPLDFERERERTKASQRSRKIERKKKMSLTLFGDIFKMVKYLKFKKST